MAATAGAGGYPGAGDPVQKYADFPIDTERANKRSFAPNQLFIFSQSPQMFPSGSMMAAKAPTPGTEVFGKAIFAPRFVACSRVASMFATST